jgi:thioesterase domain-containing protein
MLAQKEPQQENLDPVVALQPLGDRPPFFCVHGIGGDVLHLHRLAVHIGVDRPFFGLRRTPEARPTDTISQIAARYVKALLIRQPAGPFYLGGHSFGATVAYEMALQLSEQGHDIGLLAIIDQRRPDWRLTVRQALPFLHRIIFRIPSRLRDELRQVQPTDRFRMIRRILSVWSRKALGYRANADLMFDFRRMDTEQIAFHEAGFRALLDYRPRPAPIRISLFRAKAQSLLHLALDSTLGWNELAGSDVRVHVVPGTHGSIMTEPLVRELAKALSEQLEAAQARSACDAAKA